MRLFVPAFLALTVLSGGFQISVGRTPAQSAPPPPPRIESEILPNGIRISRVQRAELGDELEIAFGYRIPNRPGVSDDPGETASLVYRYLDLSVPARAVALATHYAGGTFEAVGEAGRLGMRIRVPRQNADAVLGRIARYFSHSIIHYEVFEHVRAARGESRAVPAQSDAWALQGSESGFATDAKTMGTELLLLGLSDDAGFEERSSDVDLPDAQDFIDRYLGTDRAWVVVSGVEPSIDTLPLAQVSFRPAQAPPRELEPVPAEHLDLRFDSEVEGGTILATLVPSPYYQSWFGSVVVDEILRADAGRETQFAFPLSATESVHLMRAPVRIPDYAEDVRDAWIERLVTMIYEPLPNEELRRAQARAIARLGDPRVIEWFAAEGLGTAFANGWNAILELGPDQVRVFASSFYSFRRVAAVWAPSFSEPVAVVEDLSISPEPSPAEATRELERVPGSLPALGDIGTVSPESMPLGLAPLASGITLAESDIPMVFVGGRFSEDLPGTVEAANDNGTLWSFPSGLPSDLETLLSGVRADRLLLFVPAAGMEDARSRFATWNGGGSDTVAVPTVGDYATVDLPAILVLKMWLDARLIEAGWWTDASIELRGVDGSRLLIETDAEREAVIREWIAQAARNEMGTDAFAQARRAAVGHFTRMRTDLQIILWQRARSGSIAPPNEVTREMVASVAARYF